MQMTCPRCQNSNRADAKFCLSCGAPLTPSNLPSSSPPAVPPEPSMICPQCGKTISVKAKFCNYCRQPLNQAAAPPPASAMPAPPPPYVAPVYTPQHQGLSRRQKIALVVLGCTVGVVLGVLALLVFNRFSSVGSRATLTPTETPTVSPLTTTPTLTKRRATSTPSAIKVPPSSMRPDCSSRPQGVSIAKCIIRNPDERIRDIADRHHMDVFQLRNLNSLPEDYHPQSGDCLWIRAE